VYVIYSPHHCAGWYTWHNIIELVFDPEVVNMIEIGASSEEIEDYCREHYNTTGITPYFGGADELKIEWLPEGSIFRIDEYDGAESIVLQDDDDWIVA
jgi:hypothetical protein